MLRTYLDFNASAPLRTEAKEIMFSVADEVGNPSSIHAEGRRAKAIIERARSQISEAIGELSYVTEESNKQLTNQLSEIDSTMKVGNLINTINTYQNYKNNRRLNS